MFETEGVGRVLEQSVWLLCHRREFGGAGSVRNDRFVEQSVTLCVDGARNGAASMCCNSGKLQDVWTDLGQNQEKCSKQALCGTSFVILCASNQGEKGEKCSKQAFCGTSFVNPRVSNQGEKGRSVQNRQFAEHIATLCCISRRCSKPGVSGTWCGTVRQKVRGSEKEKR